MIKVETIEENELEIYKGKRVVLYGYDKAVKELGEIFEYYNIPVFAICNESLRGRIFGKFRNPEVISPRMLKKYAEKYNDIIVQLTDFDPHKIQKQRRYMRKIGITVSDYEYGRIVTSFSPHVSLEMLDKYVHNTNNKRNIKCIEITPVNKYFLCLPMKTGDYTLENFLGGINNQEESLIKFVDKYSFIKRYLLKNDKYLKTINVWHRPARIKNYKLNKDGKMKIITAIREPIGQNLSSFFQIFDTPYYLRHWIQSEINNVPLEKREYKINDLKKIFIENGNNVQSLFEYYIKKENSAIQLNNNLETPRTIQRFLREFEDNVINLRNYSFNKEKGYSIITEGNFEIFVYQLEKLTEVMPEMCEWIGIPYENPIKGNVGEDKWYGESYKQAVKKIKITQEYFDSCYEEPYVKHFYTEEDIKKFKMKWESHLKNRV